MEILVSKWTREMARKWTEMVKKVSDGQETHEKRSAMVEKRAGSGLK